MGKQKGDGGRSKARPSSSSLAASLLPSSTPVVGFGGYVGSSRLDTTLSGEDPVPYSDVDSELALHLKRLARKDTTTKLKALSALSTLLEQKSGKDVLLAIPQWAFEYKRLLLDYNREVRRATSDTMAKLVVSVGRDIAPHLKSLMGPWWFSQFDSYSEAAQAAKRSFQAAFPAPEKRLDALILCTNEIFMYLEENLKLTPQDLSDKASAEDELKEMHQQVVSSSLLALATLLDVLISSRAEKVGFENIPAEPKHAAKAKGIAISFAEKLFSYHKCFIDFFKSRSSAIRSAAYSLLRSYIVNIQHVFSDGNVKMLSAVILGAFQENDPSCHSSMWEAMLLFLKRFPNCWNYVNVQKIVLSRFWHFLSNGCFGSQQVSYPALVLFLDSVPPKVINAERFFQEFFLNLWTGKTSSLSSNVERIAFFHALRECFLWALQNASRYSDGEDSACHFRVSLVENVLIKHLWGDFMLLPHQQNQQRVIPEASSRVSEDSPATDKRNIETPKYLSTYSHELGRSIVSILSSITSMEYDLLPLFGLAFQESCKEMLVSGNGEASIKLEPLVQFLLVLDRYAMRKGETWPLVYIMQPTLSESFTTLESLESTHAVQFLSAAVSVFGAREVVHVLSGCQEGSSSSNSDKQEGIDCEDFINIFKQRFVPWALSRNDSNTAARIDFLIALLDEECFPDQWRSIISYVVNLDVPGSAESGCVALLSVLLKEARREIAKRKVDNQGPFMSRWHHKLLDSAAIAVISSSHPFQMAAADFLCSAIGCSTEEDRVIYLSKEAFVLIYKEILKKLVGFIVGSSFTWVRQAGSLFAVEATNSDLQGLSSVARIENARFALDVLSRNLYGLSIVEEDSELVSNIIAAIFLMSWECSMLDLLDGVPDYELENLRARSELSDTLHSLLSKVSNRLCQSISAESREKLRIILAKSIRSAIFSKPDLDANKSTSLCFQWLLAVLDFVCTDQDEEDHLLEQLLYKGSEWPLWISENVLSGLTSQKNDNIVTASKVSGSQKFISLLDKLVVERGIEAVFRRAVSRSSSSDVTMENHAGLAAEILSTWEWPGGSVLTSFLPLLCSYAKNEMHYLQEGGVLDTTVGILLDAAVMEGINEVESDSRVWLSSADEVDHIEEPFLRALLSLLTRLFKDNIWQEDKARSLFDLLMSKLLTEETVNVNCLRILPPIMSVFVRTLYGSASGSTDDARSLFLRDDDQVQTAIVGWLERTLSYPPLSLWQVGLDTEEWFQLVMSCYPLDVTDRRTAPMSERKISSRERTLLLELFRKQNHGMTTSSSSTSDNSQLGLAMLSKLIVISAVYCGEDFSQEDWTFVLTQVRSWIQSAVVMMEDVAENINDLITQSSTGDDLVTVLRKLEDVVSVKDRSRVHLAESALLAFSCFSRLPQPTVSSEADDPNNQIAERWGTMKDRIVEGTLRIFFCTGLAEAISSSYNPEAASTVSSSRMSTLFFWKLIAWSAIQSPPYCRERAVKSIDFWGLSKGAISSLYSILFSSKPVASLQFAAYVILSTEPVSVLAIGEDTGSSLDPEDQDSSSSELLSEQNIHLRKEISCMLEMSPTEILQTDLLEPERVHILLAWSVLLSHLWSLPLSSSARERFVQYIQNSVNPVIIDCLFQYIFLELDEAPNFRKREKDLPAGVTDAVNAAKEAIATGSVAGLVESLWPVDLQKMTSLSGAIFGMMLCLLPAYVRGWFNHIRDRSTQSAIETFTKTWCSPPLIANELSQIKKASFVDDNFSVSVSKAANEVVATYTKDETGVDLVIRLPSSYPLREVSVNCTKSLGISELKQRKWLMSMVLFLSNQNGALAEAIRIWKCNFDKAFEGVEDCPICYSVIHTANHTLPRVACKTCKHKYHSACLYKWFSTSNKRNCPLCQSLF